MSTPELDAWFIREVLPLEAALMHFLRQARRNQGDAKDICQEVYIRVYEAARKEIPNSAKPYLFTVARNFLINQAKRDQVIAIESMADLDELGIALDEPAPDRAVMARQELIRLEAALELLPARYREVIKLSRIEGLSRGEIAIRMSVTETTVSNYLADATVELANILLYSGKIS